MTEKRHRLHAAFSGVAILGLGVAIGVVLDRHVLVPHFGGHVASIELGHVGGGPTDALSDLARELDLSQEQLARVHDVLLARQASMDAAWVAVRDHLVAALDSATAEIEVLLDPEQRDRLHAWMARRHGDAGGRQAAGEGS